MSNKQKVLNLLAGPGVGKTSTATGVFSELKWRGYNVELALEYAKDLVWNEDFKALHNQIRIFGEQYQRQKRLVGKVDLIITDSPLILGLIYGKDESSIFHQLVIEKFEEFDNRNVLLIRKKPYQQAGRVQTEEAAKTIDDEIAGLLNTNIYPFISVWGVQETVMALADQMENWINS